jgi:hypothetical protein
LNQVTVTPIANAMSGSLAVCFALQIFSGISLRALFEI